MTDIPKGCQRVPLPPIDFDEAAFEKAAIEIIADMRRHGASIRRVNFDGARFINERIDPRDWYLKPEVEDDNA